MTNNSYATHRLKLWFFELTGNLVKKLIGGVLLSTFGILGILGNILSITVLTRPTMKTDTNLILCGK